MFLVIFHSLSHSLLISIGWWITQTHKSKLTHWLLDYTNINNSETKLASFPTLICHSIFFITTVMVWIVFILFLFFFKFILYGLHSKLCVDESTQSEILIGITCILSWMFSTESFFYFNLRLCLIQLNLTVHMTTTWNTINAQNINKRCILKRFYMNKMNRKIKCETSLKAENFDFFALFDWFKIQTGQFQAKNPV